MPVLKQHAAHIAQVVILVEGKRSTDGRFLNAWMPYLRKTLPKARIGSGTDAFFTELNRNPTPPDAVDFLSFSVNPQTHATDLRTMTENLVAHRDVVDTCRVLSAGRDVRVGPVTLRMRWNLNTDTPLPPDEPVGNNPPDGAMIDYFLAQDAPVKIEIKDKKGELVRRYSSDDTPVLADAKKLKIPSYWIRPFMALTPQRGLH